MGARENTGREKEAHEREGKGGEERKPKRERESTARPSWLSLAHLLDAIQSMRGLDLVPPPQTAHIYTPRDIYRGALHRRDKDTNSTVPSAQVHDPLRRPLRPPCDSSPSSLTPFSAFCRWMPFGATLSPRARKESLVGSRFRRLLSAPCIEMCLPDKCRIAFATM